MSRCIYLLLLLFLFIYTTLNIIPTKMGRPKSPERPVKKKTGDGGAGGINADGGTNTDGGITVLVDLTPREPSIPACHSPGQCTMQKRRPKN